MAPALRHVAIPVRTGLPRPVHPSLLWHHSTGTLLPVMHFNNRRGLGLTGIIPSFPSHVSCNAPLFITHLYSLNDLWMELKRETSKENAAAAAKTGLRPENRDGRPRIGFCLALPTPYQPSTKVSAKYLPSKGGVTHDHLVPIKLTNVCA